MCRLSCLRLVPNRATLVTACAWLARSTRYSIAPQLHAVNTACRWEGVAESVKADKQRLQQKLTKMEEALNAAQVKWKQSHD